MTTRRRLLIGAIAAGAGAVALRPAQHGAAHTPDFAALARALDDAGIAWPTVVIDRARFAANAQRLRDHVQGRLSLRLVNKSLPSLGLLDEAARLTGASGQMVFNLAYLRLIACERPRTEVLMGKPLPVAAAARFLAERPDSGFEPSRQLQWLVDTPERLAQYRELARAQARPMRISLELDVGLHRGGVPDVAALRPLVQLIADEPLLQCSGFMAYDAHSQKIPDLLGARAAEHAHVLDRIAAFAAALVGSPLGPTLGDATFNTGGSLTFRLHDGRGVANEVAVGSALVKPSDFDTPLLADFAPAAFIATPVLKVGSFEAPSGVETLGAALRAWDRNQRVAHHIHGGHWLAQPVSPGGLAPSTLIGPSSNQQLLLGSGLQRLKPGDWVFLCPTQSEAVLQQLGDIAVCEGGRVVTLWPTFEARG